MPRTSKADAPVGLKNSGRIRAAAAMESGDLRKRPQRLAARKAEIERRVAGRLRQRETALAEAHERQKMESLGQLAGGAALLSSRPGAGTAVELFLPVAEIAEAPARRAPRSSVIGATPSCRVLLVEDDPLVSAAAAAMLEEIGHRVLAAPSGACALDLIRLEPRIDLVITDHAMPGMTGLELAERIRETRPALPIILASGRADLSSGCDPAMPRIGKPYRRDRLATLIAAVMAPRPPVGEIAEALGLGAPG